MDWQALTVSLQLGAATLALLLPLAIALGRLLATRRFPGKTVIEGAVALPLVLPPTVLGFYLLSSFGSRSPLGRVFDSIAGQSLAFSFEGLVVASIIVNLPFAVQPIQRAFEAIPADVREAAACCGMPPLRSLASIELPLAWPGILTAAILVFAHTLGEFGVVLMVGGNIPGETRTASIALYDETQIPGGAPGGLAAALLMLSFLSILAVQLLARRRR